MSSDRFRPPRTQAPKHLALAVISLIALFGGGGCNRTPPAMAEVPVPKVTVTEVVSRETVDTDEYTGRTEASEMVEVRARVFGYLKTVDFKDGDQVQEGQTLFTIEPDEYNAIHQQSLARIEVNAANLALAKANLARNAKLVKSGAVSQEEYETTIAAVQASEAAITAAKADANRTAVDVKYTEIKAPISGRIDRAFVARGNLLTGGTASGTLLTKIVNEHPMYVYFDVDEQSLLRYMGKRETSPGTIPGSLRSREIACYVQLANETEFSHQGQLDFSASEVDKGTGTAQVRGVFENPDRTLISGLFVRVRIPVSEPYQALIIPERALATDQNIKYVYVVDAEGTATRRTVELGAQRGTQRIVTSGLKLGERVIVKGLQRVKPGQKVEVELEPAAPPTAPDVAPATPESSPETSPSATPPVEEQPGNNR